MCGIAGFCNYNSTDIVDIIKKMTDSITYRGPDGSGYWIEKNIGIALGHRRLSIIDLSKNASQPMVSMDSRYVISYNGEIYNCEDLIEKFGIVKETLHSTSDTRILLEAIANSSVDEVLQETRGMFGFALYDRKFKSLFLARDRMGEKPLYFGFVNGLFTFASDIKCFEQIPNYKAKISRNAVNLFLELNYIPAPYTIYENIMKLEPGTILKIDFPFCEDNISIRRYWSLSDVAIRGYENIIKGSEEDVVNEIGRTLSQVVKSQMVADVPVGAFLSRGIDSSTIVAVMNLVNSGKTVETFTIGSSGKLNEALEAKKIANYLGTKHTELYIKDEDCLRVINLMPEIYSEPFGDPTAIATLFVSKLAKKYVTVALSGDGGDELFYGYTLYEAALKKWNLIRKVPQSIRCISSTLMQMIGINRGYLWESKNPYDLYEKWIIGSHKAEMLVERNIKESFFYHNRDLIYDFDIKNNYMLLDQQLYLPDSHMVKMDRASMYTSLEVRAPFLDKDMIELAWRIPIDLKYKNGEKKYILRKYAFKYIPKMLLDTPKQGFCLPFNDWLKKGKLHDLADSVFNSTNIKKENLLNDNIVKYMWNAFNKYGMYDNKIWNILMLEIWLQQHKKYIIN